LVWGDGQIQHTSRSDARFEAFNTGVEAEVTMTMQLNHVGERVLNIGANGSVFNPKFWPETKNAGKTFETITNLPLRVL
jgi:hypothetical protein